MGCMDCLVANGICVNIAQTTQNIAYYACFAQSIQHECTSADHEAVHDSTAG